MHITLLFRSFLTIICFIFAISLEASKEEVKEKEFAQRISVQARFKPIPCDNDVKVQVERIELNSNSEVSHTNLREPKSLYGSENVRSCAKNRSIQLIYTGVVSQIDPTSISSLEQNRKLSLNLEDVLYEKIFVFQKESFLEKLYEPYGKKNYHVAKGVTGSPRTFFVHCYGGYYAPGKTSVKEIHQVYFQLRDAGGFKVFTSAYLETLRAYPPGESLILPHPSEGAVYCYFIDLPTTTPLSLAGDIESGKLKISLNQDQEICFYRSIGFYQKELVSELVDIIYEKIGTQKKFPLFQHPSTSPLQKREAPQQISVQARLKSILCANNVTVQLKFVDQRDKETKTFLQKPVQIYETQDIVHKPRFYGRNKSIQLIYSGIVSQVTDFPFQPLGKEEKLSINIQNVLYVKDFAVQNKPFLEEYYKKSSSLYHTISKGISQKNVFFWRCYGGNYVPGRTYVKDIQQTYFMLDRNGSNALGTTKILSVPVDHWKQQNAPPPKDKIFPSLNYGGFSETLCYIDLSPNSPAPTSLEEDINSGKLEISLDRPDEICFYRSTGYVQNDLGSELVTIIYEKIGSLPKISSPQETPLSFAEEQAKELSWLLEENLEIPKPEESSSKLKISQNKKHRYRSPERNQNTSYTKLRNGIISELSQWEKAKDNLSYGEVNLPNVLRTVGYGGVYALDLMSTGLDKTLNTLTRGGYGSFQEMKHKGANFARKVLRRAVRLTTDNPTVAQEVGDYAYLLLSFGGGKRVGNYLKIEKLSQEVSKKSANVVKRAKNIETLTNETRPLRGLDLAGDEKLFRSSSISHRNALSQNEMVKYNFKSEIFSPAITWTSSKGTKQTYKVYQRNDIDWNMVRTSGSKKYIGKTNLEAAIQEGHAPLLKDKTAVQLHHIGQDSRGPLIEINGYIHNQKGSKILHNQYSGNKNSEFPVNRNKFDKDREAYWKQRAKDYEQK